jgi:hypothetical protein
MDKFTIKRETIAPNAQAQIGAQLSMYGMTYEDMLSYLNENLRFTSISATDERSAKGMLVMSMLSDVQEMLLRDLKEQARQLINRVKFLSLAVLEVEES